MRIRKTDSEFSKYIRTRDKWTCQRCKTRYPEKSKGLHNSHFWGRKNEATRFEPLNCDALCMGCHQYFEQNPEEFRAWKIKQLGEKKYNQLMVQAHTLQKRDDVITLLYIQQLIETLKNVDNLS